MNYKKLLPGVGDIVFFMVAWLTLFALPYLLFTDGSTGWHIVSGMHILEKGFTHTDLFSAHFVDRPWVAYEWLFDLISAFFVKMGGVPALAVLIASTLALTYTLLYDRCRQVGAGILVSFCLIVLAMLVSIMHWLARPHIFELLFLFIFVCELENYFRSTQNKKRIYIILPLTMLFWVNMHPSFALGIVITAIYALFSWTKNKDKTPAILTALLGLVTLINPSGIGLHVYILEYLKGQQILAATNEYMSPVFHGNLHSACLEILFVLFILGLAFKPKNISAPYLVVCLLSIHLALSAVRHMPVCSLILVPAIASLWSGDLLPWFSTKVKALYDFSMQDKECHYHLLPAAYSLILLFNSSNLKSDFDPGSIPTKTIDYIKANNWDPAYGLNLDNWGGILRYKLDKRVFIDDRADFYPFQYYVDYSHMMAAGTDWEKLLDKYKIAWVLFPKNSRLSQALAEKPNWKLTLEDSAATLYERVKQ